MSEIKRLTKKESEDRYKKVIKLHEVNKKTFEQIGEIIGQTRQRSWQIYCQAKSWQARQK